MKKRHFPFSFFVFLQSFRNYLHISRLSLDKKNIVFYSESGQDWHHFNQLIEVLLGKSRDVCYVTSDRNDPGLQLKNEHYHAVHIQEGFWLILFFQFLKADCLVLTMLDLHLFHLKRSINPVHYIYLFHAMGSTHMVDFENSYDHYDTILCTGPHQIAEIRARERIKHLPAKNLVEHGYARIEKLIESAITRRHPPEKPYVILIAPTWGDTSILTTCGSELIAILLQAGYRVILRPHYQTVKLSPHIIDNILSAHGNSPRFSYVNKMGDSESLFDSDLLICDWSSTSIEYALGLEKPVLYIDVPPRVRNKNYEELGLEPLEITIRKNVGMVLDPTDLANAPSKIDQLLADPNQCRDRIAAFRSKVLFNIGRSVPIGAQSIIDIADSVRRQHLQKGATTS